LGATHDDVKVYFSFVGLAYQGKKDIVFRFIIEYSSSLKGFWPLVNSSIFIRGFLKDDILACVETCDISYRVLIS